MKKISKKSWMKIFLILGLHLCLVGLILHLYCTPDTVFLKECAESISAFFSNCWEYVVRTWNKIPTPGELWDKFIDILWPFS